MADLSSLLKQIPVDDIAKQLGIDESVAEAAVQQIVPGLVAGLAANAEDPAGAASLTKALSHDRGAVHKKKVADIDTEDGKKIVKNVYGDKQDAVASKLAATATKASGAGDVTQEIIKQILPIVAPIVLAWLAEQFLGGKKEEAKPKEEESTGGALGDLLGGLLGGGSSSSSSNSTGDLIGGILGGLLGGGKK
jgi:hypothetical protein